MTKKEYLPTGHVPFAKPINVLYPEAMKELLIPFPSVQLHRYPKLNKMFGGFRPYEFTILCGATGTGKTTLCANLSRDLTEQRIKHFIASVETGHTDFIKRTISCMAGEDWNSGEAVSIERTKKFHAQYGHLFQMESAWLSLYDDRVPVEKLLADLAYMQKYHAVQVAFIDNLNFFLEVTSSKDAVIEMDRVTHELIIFCKKIPIHIVMVMHPRKKDDARVESEFDIKGSSTAVQEAHNILLFNRPHPDLLRKQIAEEKDREILVAKMRRRGKFVRRRLVLKSNDGVSYQEGDVV